MSDTQAARGPASRAEASPRLFAALREQYGLRGADDATDLGGSSNLNLLVTDRHHRHVVRVYRPWVTVARLEAMQIVRQQLERGGVPCAHPTHTRDGQSWILVDDRLVEVESYVEHDAEMDSWERLEAGLPLLGRIHALLRPLKVSAAGRIAPAANHIEPHDVLPAVRRGAQHIRQWDASPAELRLAAAAEDLARLIADAERRVAGLHRQLVHGDYWDNNVLFRAGRVVHIADLDFMGERARIDDLALTLYYTNSTFSDDRSSEHRARRLRALVDAYASGLDGPLASAERGALPLALARTPLCFIAMIPSIDSEHGARRLAAEMTGDVTWALALVRNLDRWQAVFA
jgi:homoserine kinase type II